MIGTLEKGMVRRTVLVALSDLLFSPYPVLQPQVFPRLLEALVQNIANNQDRRFLQSVRLNALKQQEKVVTGDSVDFKKLSLIPDNKSIVKIEVTDEVSYFGQQFKVFYSSNPVDVSSMLSTRSQEVLTKVVQEAK